MGQVEIVTKTDLQEFKIELLKEFKVLLQSVRTPTKEWLKGHEVRSLLNISASTLQSLRITGVLRFSKIGGNYFYKYEDILKVLEKGK
jgi:hypothetical protein